MNSRFEQNEKPPVVAGGAINSRSLVGHSDARVANQIMSTVGWNCYRDNLVFLPLLLLAGFHGVHAPRLFGLRPRNLAPSTENATRKLTLPTFHAHPWGWASTVEYRARVGVDTVFTICKLSSAHESNSQNPANPPSLCH